MVIPMREVRLNSIPATQSPKKNASYCEYRDEQHCKSDAETFVKKKQQQKNEHDCCEKNHILATCACTSCGRTSAATQTLDSETAEGDLLLFVKSADDSNDERP